MTIEPPDILLDGPPLERITFTFGGMTSDATRRGFAHLWELQRRVAVRKPGAFVRIVQPAFHEGVEASAGTHDKADVWDIEIVGWPDWYEESRLVRQVGFAGWVRSPAQGFPWHHHIISRGLPLSMYGDLVPGQLSDYNRHALGLKGQHDSGDDPQCRSKTTGRLTHKVEDLFDYTAWKEKYTVLNAEDKKWIKDTIAAALEAERGKISNAVLAENVKTNQDGSKITLRGGVRELLSE